MINNNFNLIIAGGRDFSDYNLLKNSFGFYRINNNLLNKNITIISGNAKGADILGEKLANERNYELLIFKANWDKYGKKAGFLRNEDMAKVADGLLAFWDGNSSGTKNMIDLAEKLNLITKIILYYK